MKGVFVHVPLTFSFKTPHSNVHDPLLCGLTAAPDFSNTLVVSLRKVLSQAALPFITQRKQSNSFRCNNNNQVNP
jgi:hypothetical protein